MSAGGVVPSTTYLSTAYPNAAAKTEVTVRTTPLRTAAGGPLFIPVAAGQASPGPARRRLFVVVMVVTVVVVAVLVTVVVARRRCAAGLEHGGSPGLEPRLPGRQPVPAARGDADHARVGHDAGQVVLDAAQVDV